MAHKSLKFQISLVVNENREQTDQYKWQMYQTTQLKRRQARDCKCNNTTLFYFYDFNF